MHSLGFFAAAGDLTLRAATRLAGLSLCSALQGTKDYERNRPYICVHRVFRYTPTFLLRTRRSVAVQSRIYCCLAAAESEWAHPHRTLEEAFSADRLNRVLQFLPCLLASTGDRILLFNRPADPQWEPPEGVEFQFLDEGPWDPLRDRAEPWLWAQSKAAAEYFSLPDRTKLLRTLASKSTLAQWGLAPPASCWVSSEEQLQQWLSHNPGPAVAKRALQSSGRGHLFLKEPSLECFQAPSPALRRIHLAIQENGGVLVQPWWERLFDFSSQWWCDSTPRYVGSTILLNTPAGRYVGSVVGPPGRLEELLKEHWHEHTRQCQRALQRAYALGYTGPIGMDAMVVASQEGPRLVPIVEINPRHTMGWLACRLQQTQPGSWLHVEWRKTPKPGRFPRQIFHQGQREPIGVQPHLTWSDEVPKSLFHGLLHCFS